MDLICVCIMVKNEIGTIEKTMNSVIDYTNQFVILDTGSEDGTIQCIKDICKKNNKNLKIDTVAFIDFSHNRNISLKMCYGLSKYIILLDANDQCMRMEKLIKYLKEKEKDKSEKNTFLTKYVLENDNNIVGNTKTFHKCKVIKNDVKEIYFKCPVHEYLIFPKDKQDRNFSSCGFYIYQNKLKDKPSNQRNEWDKKVLKKYIIKNKDDDCALHHFCQTLQILGLYDELEIYGKRLVNLMKKRIKDIDKVFSVSYFTGLLYLGRARFYKGKDFEECFLKAYNHCLSMFENAEVYYEMAQMFYKREDTEKSKKYIKLCCDIEYKGYPDVLTFNENIYNYFRWNLLDHLFGLDEVQKYLIKYKK